MSTSYITTYNECELNYRIAGHNQPDQLVMNPNGRWYRQCQTRLLLLVLLRHESDGHRRRRSISSARAASTHHQPSPTTDSPGALHSRIKATYSVHTYNTLLGFQTGGKLEYRFCRWTLDTHGNAGMFMNFARQDSHITTNFSGHPDPTYRDGSHAPTNTDNSFSASSDVRRFRRRVRRGGKLQVPVPTSSGTYPTT